jgi:outer membrane protein OmpA-like peptidoglycan-associated protein
MNGWYVGLEGGGNWIDDTDATSIFDADPPGGGILSTGEFTFDTGWAAIATVGYGFGRNWRAEFEAGYRSNDVDSSTAADVSEWSAMVNVLYDIHLTPSATLSLGAGAGGDFAQLHIDPASYDADDWNFAYQGIAGLAYSLTDKIDLTLTYRYLRISEPEFEGRTLGPAGLLSYSLDDVTKHTATIGLRYAFGAPAAAPMAEAAPPPPPPAAPEVARQFIVFFGFNKCNITGEADGVLSQAAEAAKQTGSASIAITGHTDTTGSPKYNQKLSECRANAAKTNLVGKGISAGSIHAMGKGENELLVQTADGVKEPQNRRAQVDLE